MDTRFLESFVTVADSGSLAEAARRLNLTAAAVTQRIRALETEVGAQLVSRNGRTVRPTRAGAAILDKSRVFLRDIRDLRVLAASDEPDGDLRLGAIASASTGLLPDVMAGLATRFTKLHIHFAPGTSSELYQRTLDGDLDGALLVEPPFELPKTCGWRRFREEPLILLAPASMQGRDPEEILRNEPLIRYDRNNWGGRLAEAWLKQANIQPRERFELDALDAIAVLVDRGVGVSLVPDWPPPWPEGLSLVKMQLPAASVGRRIGFVWSRVSPRQQLIEAFLSEAIGWVRSHKADGWKYGR